MKFDTQRLANRLAQDIALFYAKEPSRRLDGSPAPANSCLPVGVPIAGPATALWAGQFWECRRWIWGNAPI